MTSSPPTAAPPPCVHGRWQLLDEPLRDVTRAQRALDLKTQRHVTLSPLPPEQVANPARRAQMMRVVERLKALNHPYLLSVHEVFEEEPGQGTLVVEHQQSTPLKAIVARHGRLPLEVALLFAAQMLEALDHLHRHGAIHGQLTPDRVLVRHASDGIPCVALQGYSLTPASPPPAEASGSTLLGMPAPRLAAARLDVTPYTAPEQLCFEDAPSSDLYALGVMLFEMLTGELPLPCEPGEDLAQRSRLILQQPRAALRGVRGAFSAPLDALLRALTSREVAKRPTDAEATLQRLEECPEMSHSMVPIPAREFLQGSLPGGPSRQEERPQRAVWLEAFFLDRYPVSVAQFCAFVQDTKRAMPSAFFAHNDVARHALRPVTLVSWQDASEYAAWAGKALPSEAQWEHAARGVDGRTYPWGERAPEARLAHFGDHQEPAPLGERAEGASPYGVRDMAGNCFEWVNDWYQRDAYADALVPAHRGPERGTKRVLRGGSFCHGAEALRCAARGRLEPDSRRLNHSFRCAFSLF